MCMPRPRHLGHSAYRLNGIAQRAYSEGDALSCRDHVVTSFQAVRMHDRRPAMCLLQMPHQVPDEDRLAHGPPRSQPGLRDLFAERTSPGLWHRCQRSLLGDDPCPVG
jgi:hypothetical protein